MSEELQLAPQQQVSLFANALGADAETSSDDTRHPLVAHMGFAPVSRDALQARSGLELEGAVGRLPGGLFQRLACALLGENTNACAIYKRKKHVYWPHV